MPTISVAIACYNARMFIGDTLKGLGRQSRPPDEILVVDDGSTDNSRSVIDAVGGVRVIGHKTNMGIAAARNTAWQHARGKIIAYLDADAVPHPDYLKTIVKWYQNPSVDGVGGRATEYVRRTKADRFRAEVLFQHWGSHIRNKTPFIFGICASYRCSALAAMNGFDPQFKFSGEDMDLGFRLNHAGHHLMYTPHAVVRHMRSDDDRSIEKMTYRHCYGGFIAQRKNNCFLNKMTPAQSVRTFIKQVIHTPPTFEGLSYGILILRLYKTIIQAWIDAKRTVKNGCNMAGYNIKYKWEGYGPKSVQPINSPPSRKGGA
jgi:glycosyltransferase involved in cell wall biosynthesis